MTASSFRVALAKSPGLTDDDRRRRLSLAFDLLLGVADRQEERTADRGTLASDARSAAGAPLASRPEVHEV